MARAVSSRDATDLICSDLRLAVQRWRSAEGFSSALANDDIPSIRGDGTRWLTECAHRASDIAQRQEWDSREDQALASFCIVTKQPHIDSPTAVAAIIARALAFGVSIQSVRRATSGENIASVLYPTAYRYFAHSPDDARIWELLSQAFENSSFRAVFGIDYSPKLVLTGSQAIQRFGITSSQLTERWEEGRAPISYLDLLRRYGKYAATMVTDGEDSYRWFRGQWPMGIQRIAPGLMAFAMRHENLAAGEPVIILNGHYPGLAELFNGNSTVIRAGFPPGSIDIIAIRHWFAGNDNRPEECQAGSIRRDVYDNLFPVDSAVPVDSRMNVLHCSDSLLAGMVESRVLFPQRASGGYVAARLMAAGLTEDELTEIVAVDPLISSHSYGRRLTEVVAEQPITDCIDTVLRLVPPVFGPANGFASGLTLQCLAREFNLAASADAPVSRSADLRIRSLPVAPASAQSLPGNYETVGRKAIQQGSVAFVVPAGGTGGRFGGYDIPEFDRRRQKALIACLHTRGAARSSLDVRLANARFWRAECAGKLPLAVMASPTNRQFLGEWQQEQVSAGIDDIIIYQQWGAYRLSAPGSRPVELGRLWWIDHILRHADGSPSLKPPGNFGTLTCLVLSGVLDIWNDRGIEFLVIANGDDVGFRLDPRIVGLLRSSPALDAVITTVPWGVRGTIEIDGRKHEVRGDASGWCQVQLIERAYLGHEGESSVSIHIGQQGYSLISPAFDVAGLVCEVKDDAAWRLTVVESSSCRTTETASLLSTNQIYLRASTLRRIMGLDGTVSVPDAVSRFVEQQAFYAERKAVLVDGMKAEALQVGQAMSCIFSQISIEPLLISRSPQPGQYGGYAVLKTGADVQFAQRLLDDSGGDDQLIFAES